MKNFKNISDRGRGDDSRERGFKRRDPEKRQFGNRDRERPQMYEATCSDCGKKCEVPFKPTGDKPVYCSQCFTSHGGGQKSNRFERGDRERPRSQDRRMFDAICDKCGKRFKLPFKPTGGKPVYCNECFDKGGDSSSSDKVINQYKEQFDVLNVKLDKIIKILTPVISVKKEKKAVVVKKEKAKNFKKVLPKKSVDKKKVKK